MCKVFGVIYRAYLELVHADTSLAGDIHPALHSFIRREKVNDLVVARRRWNCHGVKAVLVVIPVEPAPLVLPYHQKRTAHNSTQQHSRKKQCGKALFVPAPIFERKACKLLCGAAA